MLHFKGSTGSRSNSPLNFFIYNVRSLTVKALQRIGPENLWVKSSVQKKPKALENVFLIKKITGKSMCAYKLKVKNEDSPKWLAEAKD